MDRFTVKDQNSLLSSPVSSGDCMAAAAQAAASDLLFRIRFENIIVYHASFSSLCMIKTGQFTFYYISFPSISLLLATNLVSSSAESGLLASTARS